MVSCLSKEPLGCSNAFSYIKSSIQPEPITSEWGGRKVYAILRNMCIAISAVSAIAAIYTAAILSAPFFLLSISFLTAGLVASYNLKKLLLTPTAENSNKLVQDVVADVRSDFPEMNTQRTDLLIKHALYQCFPDNFTQQEKEELDKDIARREPETITIEEFTAMKEDYVKQIELSDDIDDHLNFLTQEQESEKEQVVPQEIPFTQQEVEHILGEIEEREKNRYRLLDLLEQGVL